jgi:hypothetical protein
MIVFVHTGQSDRRVAQAECVGVVASPTQHAHWRAIGAECGHTVCCTVDASNCNQHAQQRHCNDADDDDDDESRVGAQHSVGDLGAHQQRRSDARCCQR